MGIKKEVTIGDCRLLLGDCMEIMPLLDRVDAVVTDPPYGINFKGKTRSTKRDDKYAGGHYAQNHKNIIGDDKPFDPSHLMGVPCIIWGANNFASKLTDSNGWLCWHKDGGIKGFNMSEVELAYTNFLGSTKHISHLWHGFKRASEMGQKVLHPTQKPIAIMQWCITHLPKDTPTILDPFMGSGTTGVACAKMGRKFIGIELDEDYFNIACKRIEEAYKSPDMFIEAAKKPEQDSFLD
jgi:DNA modification methylase